MLYSCIHLATVGVKWLTCLQMDEDSPYCVCATDAWSWSQRVRGSSARPVPCRQELWLGDCPSTAAQWSQAWLHQHQFSSYPLSCLCGL